MKLEANVKLEKVELESTMPEVVIELNGPLYYERRRGDVSNEI